MFMPILFAVCLGSLGGAASMLLYRRVSPQRRLVELSLACAAARRDLQQFTGDDWATVSRLARRAVSLAVARVRLVILPTAAAVLPVIALASWLECRVDTTAWVAPAPWGLGSLATFFWLPLIGAAMATKLLLGIR